MNKTLDETVPMPSVADESTVSEHVKIKPKNIRDKTNKYCDVCNITLDKDTLAKKENLKRIINHVKVSKKPERSEIKNSRVNYICKVDVIT